MQNNPLDSNNLLNSIALNQEDILSQIMIENYGELNDNENNQKETKKETINNNEDIKLKEEKKIPKIKETKSKKTFNTNIGVKKMKKETTKVIDDRAFNRLKELQTLYKKESSLKELFIQTSDKIKTNINQYCIDIFKKKLDVQNILQKINSKDLDTEIKKSILYEDKSFLGNLNNYIPNFFKFLWENPEIIAEILMNAEIQDVKEYLAPFISNNFYENILSSNYIEDYLLYVMCILLKDEINKMKSYNDFSIFLCSTACGCLMSQLCQKRDVQEYFKLILEEVIEQIEITCSNKKMTCKIKEIEELLQYNNRDKNDDKNSLKNKAKSTKKTKNKIKKKDIEDMINYDTITATSFNMTLSFLNFDNEEDRFHSKNKKNEKSKEEEFTKLFSTPMDRELLEKFIMEKKSDSKLNEYLVLQLKKMGEDKDIYSNKKFIDKAGISEYSQQIFESYQHDFINITTFIDKILDKLIENSHFLPYSIKCLCRIISTLIRKKFPQINAVEENAFISQFFFYNLFVPIFNNPSTGALINNFIISGNTLHNLNIISYIILQFASGNFFKNNLKNGDFTLYNSFFVEKMPKLFQFFEKLTRAELPSFIKKFINDKLPDDYKYDYFKENPDKIMFHRTICYSLSDLSALLDNIENCKKKLFVNDNTKNFQKTFEKLNNKASRTLMNNLIKNQKKEIIQKIIPRGKKPPEIKEIEGKKQIYYFMESELLCNEKYTQLFLITQKTPYFNIKEGKKSTNKDEIMKNTIIKVKNFFSALLYNYIELVRKDFNENSVSNIKDILNQLNIFLKSSNFVVDGKIPMKWYVTSLIEYLDKIPKELTNNNCELLFKEIEGDLNKSLKELDFEALSVCLGYMKFSQKGFSYYEEAKKCLIDIEINNIVKKIIEEESIPVNIEFKYTKSTKEFRIINKSKEKKIILLDSMIFDIKRKPILCETIQIFAKKFPDLSQYKKFQDIDLFQLQEELKVPEKLDYYFSIIKEHLLENKKILEHEETYINEEKTMEIINDKIYDYVMTKIYQKLYPAESDKFDNSIFSKCVKLCWTEPKNFIKDKTNYIYDSFLPDVLLYFKKIDMEKSPRRKLLNMSKIFNSISNLVDFNSGEGKTDIGVDDQMPILNYCFVKAQPERIYSNCKYMELYIGDKSSKEEGNQLSQLMGICIYVKDITYKSLFETNEKEFNLKCTQAALNQI